MRRDLTRAMVIALAVGALMFAVPSVSMAINITSVSVTIGGVTWCDTTGACVANGSGDGGKIWNLGVGGVDLTGGRALILTQGQLTQTNYNFDTSEFQGNNIPVITINGVVFTDPGMILNDHGTDPETAGHQESVDWTDRGIISGIRLWVGYADNAHGGVAAAGSFQCADANHTCLPENPWQGSPNTTFLGNSISGGCNNPGTVVINPALSCFDAGALRIEQVVTTTPEPTVLLTLGIGLVGLALLSRKRLKA